MLRKNFLSVVFVLLFALVQAGIVTHEISHFQDIRHHQQDKQTTTEQCAQCLGMAHADGVLPVTVSGVQLPLAEQHWCVAGITCAPSAHRSVYAARAPPVVIHA